MVRAILDGSKTQTRRIVKPQPMGSPVRYTDYGSGWMPESNSGKVGIFGVGPIPCPYGQPGDQLWVRETWRCGWSEAMSEPFLQYQADGEIVMPETSARHNDMAKYLPDGTESTKPSFRPSIHLPRWGSRITLEITGIRVERLRDISEKDAIAEGLSTVTKDGKSWKWGIPDRDGLPGNDNVGWHWQEWERDPRDAYRHLWESINGPGSWDANPWVWVVKFKRIEGGAK